MGSEDPVARAVRENAPLDPVGDGVVQRLIDPLGVIGRFLQGLCLDVENRLVVDQKRQIDLAVPGSVFAAHLGRIVRIPSKSVESGLDEEANRGRLVHSAFLCRVVAGDFLSDIGQHVRELRAVGHGHGHLAVLPGVPAAESTTVVTFHQKHRGVATTIDVTWQALANQQSAVTPR